MNRTLDDVHYTLWGRRFFPSQMTLRGAVAMSKAKDTGSVGAAGKYRGRKTPYGSCEIHCTKEGRNISFLADHLRRNLARYRKAGAQHVVFWILWRGTQGNTELTARELSKLAATRVPLAMDYVLIEAKEEPNQPPEPTRASAGLRIEPQRRVAHLCSAKKAFRRALS